MTTTRGGRPAKPKALRLLHGDRPDRILDDEPMPDPAMPDRPPLSAKAAEVWERTAPMLVEMGVLTAADGVALACYCEAVVTLERASQLVAATDVLIRSKHDQPIRNPALIAQRDAMRTVLAFAREFGLTPAARHGVSVPTARRDEREELLS